MNKRDKETIIIKNGYINYAPFRLCFLNNICEFWYEFNFRNPKSGYISL